jgi:hypothetical protein
MNPAFSLGNLFESSWEAPRFVMGFALGAIIGIPILFFFYRRSVRMGVVGTFLSTLLGTAIAGYVTLIHVQHGLGPRRRGDPNQDFDFLLAVAGITFFWMFIAPFLWMLYRNWIGGKASEQEKLPGAEGVRAWIGGGKLLVAVALAFGASRGFDQSLFAMSFLTIGALLVRPALASLSTSKPTPPEKPEDLTGDRERVLSMLEQGKITAEESSDLLNALNESVRQSRSPSVPMTPDRRMGFVGMGLVLVGFFLPWLSFDAGKEMNRMTGPMMRQMEQFRDSIPLGLNMQSGNMPQMNFNTGSSRFAGGDIGKGLGWIILILGIAAAVLPYIAGTVAPHTQRLIVLGLLGCGAVILLYLLTKNLRYLSIGIPVVIVGYVLEAIGPIRELSENDTV